MRSSKQLHIKGKNSGTIQRFSSPVVPTWNALSDKVAIALLVEDSFKSRLDKYILTHR